MSMLVDHNEMNIGRCPLDDIYALKLSQSLQGIGDFDTTIYRRRVYLAIKFHQTHQICHIFYCDHSREFAAKVCFKFIASNTATLPNT
jgi:hypothetical protein